MIGMIEATLLIFADLQRSVGRILAESGYLTEVDHPLVTARGSVNIDVFAVDPTTPPGIFLIECKLWGKRVPKATVHSFRSVIADGGGNVRLLISSAGFQKGAFDAADKTNLLLVDWEGFQGMFATRWFERWMVPCIREELDSLIQYTEPINSGILRRADHLPAADRDRFRDLRDRHSSWDDRCGNLQFLMAHRSGPSSAAS